MTTPGQYEYDIFISYSRDGGVQKWIIKHLKPALELYLPHLIGRDPKIFIDFEMPDGTIWESKLKHAIAHSACMVGVFNRLYCQAHKEWCHREFAAMHFRSVKLNFVKEHKSLILPLFTVRDPKLPSLLKGLQGQEIWEYFFKNAKLSDVKEEELEREILKPFIKEIANRLEEVPECSTEWSSPEWTDDAYLEFKDQIQIPPNYDDLLNG